MKKLKILKNKELLISIIISAIIVTPIFAYENYMDSKYVYIKPIIAIKDIHTGERFTADSILIGQNEQVLKEEVNNYLTSENYQEVLSKNSYFTKNIKQEKRLEFQDLC